MREAKLYRPVAAFLERRHGCLRGATWTAGCGRDLAFPAGFGKRKPDVVACKQHPVNPLVHIAEGKLLNVPAHGFDATVAQLESIRHYGDYLWAVFPESHWISASQNHDRWMTQLRQRGFGLLVVDGGRATMKLDPMQNERVDKDSKRSLLDQLLGESDDPVQLEALGAVAGEAAARAAARVAEIMTGPVRDYVDKNLKESTLTSASHYFTSGKPMFAVGYVEWGNAYIQGDPFGRYFGDGRPVIWVWRYCGNLGEDEKTVKKVLAQGHDSEVYFYVDDGDTEWMCRPLAELDLEAVKAAGFLGEFSLGRAISVVNRTMAGIDTDLHQLVPWARV